MHHYELVEQVHRLLLDNLPIKSSKTPSGWITFNCPICDDKRKRSGVSQTGPKISFHCFNCGFTTGWSPSPRLGTKFKKLLETLSVDSKQVHNVVLLLMKHAEQLDIADDTDYVFSTAKFDEVTLPESAMLVTDLPDSNLVKQYAIRRGLINLCPLLYFDEIVQRKRLYVPFLFNNSLVGWTGRHIDPPDKQTPKYLSNMPQGYVFNMDKFVNDTREVVIVTEGVFDAILIDGISVLGNSVTPEQAHLISTLNKRVILCPDRDKPGKKLIDQAVELGWEVSFPPWSNECKDAADAVDKYGRLLTVSSIINHSVDNKIKVQVKSKML